MLYVKSRTFIDEEIFNSIEMRWRRAYHLKEPTLINEFILSLIRLSCCSLESRSTALVALGKKDNVHSWSKHSHSLPQKELEHYLRSATVRSLYQDILYKFITGKKDDEFIKRDVLNYVKSRRVNDIKED